RIDIPLQNDLGVGWNLDIDRFAIYEMDRFVPEKTSEKHFVDSGRQRSDRAEDTGRIAAKHHCGLYPLALFFAPAVMLRADFVELPVHARRAAIVYLDPIHADIPLTSCRIIGEDKRKCDKRTTVLRPAVEHRKPRKVDVVPGLHDLLADPG